MKLGSWEACRICIQLTNIRSGTKRVEDQGRSTESLHLAQGKLHGNLRSR